MLLCSETNIKNNGVILNILYNALSHSYKLHLTQSITIQTLCNQYYIAHVRQICKVTVITE